MPAPSIHNAAFQDCAYIRFRAILALPQKCGLFKFCIPVVRQGEEVSDMKTSIIFTGTGPILIMTSYKSLTNPDFVEKLAAKGIKKFIASDLPVEKVKERYGKHFDIVMNDLLQEDDLRVLDYNGHSIFLNFSFTEMGKPVYYEP